MKRQILVISSVLLILQASAGHGNFNPAPRTGRPFQSCRNPFYPLQCVGASVVCGLFFGEPHLLLTGPIIGLGDLVCSPIYDLACLPRDIVIRCSEGVTAHVLDLDGNPVPNVKLKAFVPDASSIYTSASACVGTYKTGKDGTVYIPYSRNQVWLAGIDKSLADAGYEPYPHSMNSAAVPEEKNGHKAPEMRIFCTRIGTLPACWSQETTADITVDTIVDIDLQTGRIEEPALNNTGIGLRIRNEVSLKLGVITGACGAMRRMKVEEVPSADLRTLLVPHSNSDYVCEMPGELPPGEVLVFQNYKENGILGAVTSFKVYSDPETNHTMVHLKWTCTRDPKARTIHLDR